MGVLDYPIAELSVQEQPMLHILKEITVKSISSGHRIYLE